MMSTPLPIPKITRPSLPAVFARPRLFKLLDRSLNHAIVWMSGPAGVGKSTLIVNYLTVRKIPILWYQIDAGDADPATFFYYLGLLSKQAAPRYKTPLPLFTPEYGPGLEVFTRRFVRELCKRLSRNYALVLDNYHAVPPGSPVHEVIRFVLEEMPETCHVIVTSRSNAPSSLARLRASQRLEVITGDKLLATREETRGILQLKYQLSQKKIQTLHEVSGGWIAGIILMAQRMSMDQADEYIALDSSTKDIFEYFAGEIFDRTDADVQEFLLQTAILEKITVSLARELTGFARTESILNVLVTGNYFTEQHGNVDAVYQYHGLFREFLLNRAQEAWTPAFIAQVRHRAAKLLERAGAYEQAADLYLQAQDWAAVEGLILRQAQQLISQGRYATIERWLTELPAAILEDDPWLLYWLGICRLQFNPPQSRDYLQRAFEYFRQQEETIGYLLAWSGIVNTILFEFDDMARLDNWVSWLDEWMANNQAFPTPEIEARVAADMVNILFYRKLDHPEIHHWMARALLLARTSPDHNMRLQVVSNIFHYYVWTGQFHSAGEMLSELKTLYHLEGVIPFLLIQAKMKEANYYHATLAKARDITLKTVSDGLNIGRSHGIRLMDQFLCAQVVYASMNEGDFMMTEDFLSKMEASLNRNMRMDLCHYYYVSTLFALCREDAVQALHHARKGIEMVSQIGMPFPEALFYLAMAKAQHANDDRRLAASYLTKAKDLSHHIGAEILVYACLLTVAEFEFASETGTFDATGLKALRKAMKIGRTRGYVTVPGWQPKVMARLCRKALEHNIESEYVTSLIREQELILENKEAIECEVWPWLIKIYTLGRFNIVYEGVPLQFIARGQEKVLDLLKTLIAMGGRNVSAEVLAEALWPEAEGDKAHQTFKTTVHRLRKLLGKSEVIVVRDGRVSLDSRYCWVDAYALERLLGRKPYDLAASEKAVFLYQGRFLDQMDDSAWVMALRERLHAKFVRHVSELGNRLEIGGEWKKAAHYYQQGLNVDPLVEEFYQRLMICHRNLGHRAEALSVYRRCRDALRAHLDVTPTPETDALYYVIHDDTAN